MREAVGDEADGNGFVAVLRKTQRKRRRGACKGDDLRKLRAVNTNVCVDKRLEYSDAGEQQAFFCCDICVTSADSSENSLLRYCYEERVGEGTLLFLDFICVVVYKFGGGRHSLCGVYARGVGGYQGVDIRQLPRAVDSVLHCAFNACGAG